MGSLYRSGEICLAQLYLQTESAFACVSELGELGLAEFIDLNPVENAFQRKFVNDVRRCDEMERKLRFLERELTKDGISITDNGENPGAPLPKEMIDMEAKFEKLESDMREVNVNQEQLKRNFLELTELKYILLKAQSFFEEATLQHELDDFDRDGGEVPLASSEGRRSFARLEFVAGVIKREKILAFERVLWRACRGNVFVRHSDIDEPMEDPTTRDMVSKSVFVIFYQGDQLKSRVKKICEGFQASLYSCPETAEERRSVLEVLSVRIEDMKAVLYQTEDHRKLVLSQVSLNIRVWMIKVRKIKAIYHTLNLFNVNIAEKCLIGECWCPVDDLDKMQLALQKGTELSGSSVPSILHRTSTTKAAPTFNKTDKFTFGFQNLVDSYGIARYREINPAPFTIITFPFLFAIMFGDMGHGLLMFLFALYCILNEKRFMEEKSPNEIWQMIFGGRYLILLMGLFSVYTGFLYNECFSRSLNAFGSAWNVSAMNYSDERLMDPQETLFQLNPGDEGVFRRQNEEPFDPSNIGNPYPYGMDPIWQSAKNKITFQNSFKEKAAVIVGFSQMLFGLILSLLNHIYFKRYLSIVCEWLPQMLFIWSVIGYLCFLIILKWSTWTVAQAQTAPSLLIGLINMFMFTAPDASNLPVYGGSTSKTQFYVQIGIVLLAISCIPWMLLSRPLVLYRRHKKRSKRQMEYSDRIGVNGDVDDDEAPLVEEDQLASTSVEQEEEQSHKKEEEFDFGEAMIHQMIHTIEYCLNCISHTASYLRLWALSLAHSELSEVLWTMVMHNGLSVSGYTGGVFAFVVFWAFAGLTVAILLVMEGLSAFLHALRLHWVEFQSKFYAGDGYLFVPFSFDSIVSGQVEE